MTPEPGVPLLLGVGPPGEWYELFAAFAISPVCGIVRTPQPKRLCQSPGE